MARIGIAEHAGTGLDDMCPLGIVIIAACGNEVLDRINLGNWNWPDTRMDLFNTIIWRSRPSSSPGPYGAAARPPPAGKPRPNPIEPAAANPDFT